MCYKLILVIRVWCLLFEKTFGTNKIREIGVKLGLSPACN